MRVTALVDDLLDRSRVAAAVPDTVFVRDVPALGAADVVVVDLGGHGADVPRVRAALPDARLVTFGRHDDPDALAAALAAGADLAWPRSRFFRDPRAAVAPAV